MVLIHFFLLISILQTCISREIGPSASYFLPWDPDHNQISQNSNTVNVEDEKFESYTKTGTTIVGLCCTDGIVLGADTRSTGGPLVMDKNKLKIHNIAARIFCCAAGTSADCDQITRRAGIITLFLFLSFSLYSIINRSLHGLIWYILPSF